VKAHQLLHSRPELVDRDDARVVIVEHLKRLKDVLCPMPMLASDSDQREELLKVDEVIAWVSGAGQTGRW
jgi:hypothetical protein